MDLDLIPKFVAAVAPGMVACALIMWLAARRRSMERLRARAWAAPLALGLAFLLAFAVINGFSIAWPPNERWKWLGVAGFVAMGLAIISAAWKPFRGGRVLLAVGAAVSMGALLHPTPVESHPVLLRVAVAAIVFAAAVSLTAIRLVQRGAIGPLTTSICFIGAAFVALRSGFGTLSLMIWAVALALMVMTIAAWRWPQLEFAPGGALWCATMLPVLMGVAADDGYNTGDVPRWCFAVIAAAPLMLWLGEWRGVQARSFALAACIRIGLVTAPVIAAVVAASASP
jgi:hypothetical protein